MICSVAGKYAQMLFISKKIHSNCIFLPTTEKLCKSDQNLSIKFRGLSCGESETAGQVNLNSERNMQQQHEGGDVGGGHCGVRG